MSDIQDDQKLVDSRKNALKEVDAPLRDQIVKKLYDKVLELGLNQKTVTVWDRSIANRSMWNERQRAWLQSWDDHLVSDTSGTFSGSSQLHLPIAFIVCKTMHARFLQALWQDPPFTVKAKNEASIDNVELVADVIYYYLTKGANYDKGVGMTLDHWVWDWITQGSGLMKLRWDVQYSRYLDVELEAQPQEPRVVSQNGQEFLVPQVKYVEKEVNRVKKCFDGPVFDLLNLEDVVINGGGGDPDAADSVIHREYLTASQLLTLADRKIFNKDAVMEVIRGGADRQDGSPGNETKLDRARNAGKPNLDNDQDLDRYEILEHHAKADVDGSGINADVILWVHRKSKELLRATYLYRISPRGYRPFIKADFQPRKGSEYAVGMVELLYPLAKEMDAIHNMRIDFGLISTMPFGFYRASSGIDPETIQLEPGALIPVDNPQTDVFFPNIGNRTVFGFQEEAALQSMVERLTSISDLNLGVVGGQGATRTATGARALMSEMSSNLDVYLRRLNHGWAGALCKLFDMLQLRIPQGLAFRLTGNKGAEVFRKINSAKDIQGDFDLEVSPNSATSNQAIQEAKSAEILQLVSNPLAIQLGIITPAQFYNAMENYLKARGVKDYAKYVNRPQGPLRVLSPEEEANRILRGMPVQVTPEMDHEGFIAYFQEIMGSDELLGQFSEDQAIELAKQAKQHEQMLQALKDMAAQQANSAQMQRNASMSAQQAPVQLPVGNGAPGGEPIQ